MAKVLLITTNYWPEPTGISVYTTDLAEYLNQAGYSVSVLTSLPHYPWWKIPREYAHLTEGLFEQNGVKVFRAKHLIPQKMNALIRIRFEISLLWNLRRVSKGFKSGEFDLVLACIPTVAAGIVGKAIARKLQLPFGLIVQDLSGVGARQSGLLGGALFSKVAQAIEASAIKAAKGLVVISPAMRDVIHGLGIEGTRISQIFNYSARTIDSSNRENARKLFGWNAADFLVIHTGNMGAKQDLENVVRAVDKLPVTSRIKVKIVGHGNQETNLRALCLGKRNIEVLPAVEDSTYSALLSSADLLLVNERPTQKEMSLPSKLTSYLYSQRPVLAAVPKDGATWKFLEGIAERVDAGKPELLADAIEELSRNDERRVELALKGLRFATTHLDPVLGRKKYLDWVENLIESKHG
ncbi:MAG: glycosyltransferase WbuB [Actinobacteria bacterium]|jgi:glycosyltransferase involved in cell wall biosynthesis|nr:glycosyltransferase WbuB [Actinomycetota bacterium]